MDDLRVFCGNNTRIYTAREMQAAIALLELSCGPVVFSEQQPPQDDTELLENENLFQTENQQEFQSSADIEYVEEEHVQNYSIADVPDIAAEYSISSYTDDDEYNVAPDVAAEYVIDSNDASDMIQNAPIDYSLPMRDNGVQTQNNAAEYCINQSTVNALPLMEFDNVPSVPGVPVLHNDDLNTNSVQFEQIETVEIKNFVEVSNNAGFATQMDDMGALVGSNMESEKMLQLDHAQNANSNTFMNSATEIGTYGNGGTYVCKKSEVTSLWYDNMQIIEQEKVEYHDPIVYYRNVNYGPLEQSSQSVHVLDPINPNTLTNVETPIGEIDNKNIPDFYNVYSFENSENCKPN